MLFIKPQHFGFYFSSIFAKSQIINTFTASVLSESSRKGPHHPLVKNIIRMYWTTAAATAGTTSAVPASSLKMAPKLDFSVKTMLLFFVLFISPLLFNYHSVIAEEQNDDNEEFLSSDCSNGASFKGQKISKRKMVCSVFNSWKKKWKQIPNFCPNRSLNQTNK